ncbi:MAG: hypothetical protein GY904_24030 [Planctomycetaceae bacterium]|nr:hypothetical protein [Planctomycetaceae bacterium]
MQNECEEEKRSPECGESFVENYAIASSWKCSDWFPAKISACYTALAFVCVIALFVFALNIFLVESFLGALRAVAGLHPHPCLAASNA